MQRERERRSWSEKDRARSQSYRAEAVVNPDIAARQASASKQYRAALEALFDKKPEAAERIEKIVPTISLPRVVEAQPGDVGSNKRQDLLRKIGVAQGSRAISDAVEAFLAAGYTLPDEQEVFLQILEHRDETRVREAISQLQRLLAGQMPKRKPVLVQRLKRIEETADESETRDAASSLRGMVA